MSPPFKDIRGTLMALHQKGIERDRIVSLVPILVKPPDQVSRMVEYVEREVLAQRNSAFLLVIEAIFLVNDNQVRLRLGYYHRCDYPLRKQSSRCPFRSAAIAATIDRPTCTE
ncbi:hypothetical protein HK104_005155 [Borealophlyctis nickersoniae]|nr:hypothetical protein HK104_005155 [Borealophlyctis nickersoniae]